MFWRTFALALAVMITVSVFAVPRTAGAQPKGGAPKTGASVSPPGSTPVLTFETDDADEQADAFTAALRARMKAAPGWTLSDNTFSLGILTAALRCRIDAPCLQRVGEQLKADKFFWGRLTRLGKNQVVVEAHFWQRNKHDSVVKETYSDDLRDPNSEGLKKVANRVFERLTNTQTTGTLAVQAGHAGGTVFVDGAEAAQLAGGYATVELKAGSHTVEVRAPGSVPVRRTVNVVVGSETPVSMVLASDTTNDTAPPPPHETSPAPDNGRRILSYGLIGAGVVAGAVGIVFAAQWYGNRSDANALKKDYAVKDPCAGQAGASPTAVKSMQDACALGEDATTVSTVGWIAGGAGAALIGTGVVLLVTGKGSGTSASAPTPRSWALAPSIGPREGSLRVNVSF